MHGWILFFGLLFSFVAGWAVNQIYGGYLIKKLQSEKAALQAELTGLRTAAGSWLGGQATKANPKV